MVYEWSRLKVQFASWIWYPEYGEDYETHR